MQKISYCKSTTKISEEIIDKTIVQTILSEMKWTTCFNSESCVTTEITA